jgi:hypothetical protein
VHDVFLGITAIEQKLEFISRKRNNFPSTRGKWYKLRKENVFLSDT